MNILVIFAAGVTVGWVADKLYQRVRTSNNQADAEVEAEVVEDGKTVELTDDDRSKAKPKEKAKSESIVKKEVKADKERRDDLSQLKGVGPKLAEALDEIGIYNYVQLSASSVDMLLEQLRETGGRFTRSVVSSIVDGAKQAAEEK
ncbi:MAG: hypothetical protein DSZ28_04525 [Thiothrix sp.]|nr:MAG: hypothetical protein DSZ28_04525 [Thiothrix sp.]